MVSWEVVSTPILLSCTRCPCVASTARASGRPVVASLPFATDVPFGLVQSRPPYVKKWECDLAPLDARLRLDQILGEGALHHLSWQQQVRRVSV